MVQVEMFSKILWYLEKEGALVLEDNEDTIRKAGDTGPQRPLQPGKAKNLLKHQVDVTTKPHGHTCGFSFAEAETTEMHNRSLQDKRNYNYNFGLFK